MRSSAIISAFFAAGALAVPFGRMAANEKRDVQTSYEVVYVTEYYTTTYGASTKATTSTKKATSTAKATSAQLTSTSTRKSSAKATSTKKTTVSKAATAASSTAAASHASSSSSSSTEAASAKPTSYEDIVVYHHNLHRANHSAPDVAWSDSLAATAKVIADSCTYAHNITANGGGYGQNIAAGVASNNVSAIITDLFYNGEVNFFNGLYGQAQPDMTNFERWGHFSQIVWKDTTAVGCATVDCSASGLANVGSDVSPHFTVCNYEAPGNYANEYASNIGSSLGKASANWNTGL